MVDAVTATEEVAKVEEEVNPLGMSDADFLNSAAPAAVVEEPVVDEAAAAETARLSAEAAATAPVLEPKADDAPVVEAKTPEEVNAAADAVAAAAVVDPKAAVPGADPAGSGVVEDKPAVIADTPVDHEAFYKQIMAPFKANGKTIELKTPEEALQLMQMGANYTKKMQDMVPARKMLTMLENNKVDEDRLSFLIDLDKKDPEAIKKLLKDSGVDPLAIDTTTEPAYLEGNHRVTDEEVNFRTTLDELGSTPNGKETLQAINTWDQASKETLWKNPGTMAVIHAQREVGIYDRIVAEMDRQTTLGMLSPGTTFLQGYKIVGDELTAANAFQDLKDKYETKVDPAPVTKVTEEPKVVATRVGTPKSPVANEDAAKAAAASRSTPAAAKEFVNPLAMSDAEFLKLNQFDGRL